MGQHVDEGLALHRWCEFGARGARHALASSDGKGTQPEWHSRDGQMRTTKSAQRVRKEQPLVERADLQLGWKKTSTAGESGPTAGLDKSNHCGKERTRKDKFEEASKMKRR